MRLRNIVQYNKVFSEIEGMGELLYEIATIATYFCKIAFK